MQKLRAAMLLSASHWWAVESFIIIIVCFFDSRLFKVMKYEND